MYGVGYISELFERGCQYLGVLREVVAAEELELFLPPALDEVNVGVVVVGLEIVSEFTNHLNIILSYTLIWLLESSMPY